MVPLDLVPDAAVKSQGRRATASLAVQPEGWREQVLKPPWLGGIGAPARRRSERSRRCALGPRADCISAERAIARSLGATRTASVRTDRRCGSAAPADQAGARCAGPAGVDRAFRQQMVAVLLTGAIHQEQAKRPSPSGATGNLGITTPPHRRRFAGTLLPATAQHFPMAETPFRNSPAPRTRHRP